MKKIMLLLFLGAALGCQNEKVEADCVEQSRDNRGCYAIVDPVCGCNGITYSNDCEAEAVGITNYNKGKCKQDG